MPPLGATVGTGGGGGLVGTAVGAPQLTVTVVVPLTPPALAVIVAVPEEAPAVKMVRMPPPLVGAEVGLREPEVEVTETVVPSAMLTPPAFTTTVTKDEPLQFTVLGAAETVTAVAPAGVVVTVGVTVAVVVAVTVAVGVETSQLSTVSVTTTLPVSAVVSSSGSVAQSYASGRLTRLIVYTLASVVAQASFSRMRPVVVVSSLVPPSV